MEVCCCFLKTYCFFKRSKKRMAIVSSNISNNSEAYLSFCKIYNKINPEATMSTVKSGWSFALKL